MKGNVDPCTCAGVELSSREAPFTGGRLGKTIVPCREQLCRGLQGQGAAQHWFWERQGEGRAVLPDCCWTQREEGVVLLALLTSCGQKTLLALKAGRCRMQAPASGTLTCTQDNPARDFWLSGTRSDELPEFALC